MGNPNEQQLSYAFGDHLPPHGATLELAPGVHWARMPLPFALDHINVWLLADDDEGQAGWSIVDCGVSNDGTRSAWESIFAHTLAGQPVLRVLATHMHPDHVGLAHWLTAHWSTPERDCRLWMSVGDWNAARMAAQKTTGFGGEAAAMFFASHGLVDPSAQAKVRARGNYYSSMVPQVPAQFRRLLDGQVVRIGAHEWVCMVGYGHAPEHISLYCAELKLLISGDMVLPRISTNVSVIDLEPEANPLPLYLASLDRLLALPADTLVLPSHGKPFRGLHERVAQLHAHHEERLADLLQACRQAPCSAADALPVLFQRELDLHQTTFAMGEAIAHLHALWHSGALRRVRDAAGVWRFTPGVSPA
jgi:glyoxylase-like metal-dependent hydrolase (beta-lactamase superfamily II)